MKPMEGAARNPEKPKKKLTMGDLARVGAAVLALGGAAEIGKQMIGNAQAQEIAHSIAEAAKAEPSQNDYSFDSGYDDFGVWVDALPTDTEWHSGSFTVDVPYPPAGSEEYKYDQPFSPLDGGFEEEVK